VHYTTSCNTQYSAPEDGQNNCPKHVELTGIIKLAVMYFTQLLHLRTQCPWTSEATVIREIRDICNRTILIHFQECDIHFHLWNSIRRI